MKKREESKENSYIPIKILVCGDFSGKTSVIQRYLTGIFKENAKKMTIGVDFYSKSAEVNGKKIRLQIWDFGGEERFRLVMR
ncbi:MAG: ADP-ribosylation factor-like protein [Promethearchaeota archaeon]